MRGIEIRQDDVRRRAQRKNGINSETEKRGSTTEREKGRERGKWKTFCEQRLKAKFTQLVKVFVQFEEVQ